jgi:hypothetical protein
VLKYNTKIPDIWGFFEHCCLVVSYFSKQNKNNINKIYLVYKKQKNTNIKTKQNSLQQYNNTTYPDTFAVSVIVAL